MMIWFGAAVILGILTGVVTGLVPGIHTNLVAVFITSCVFLQKNFSAETIIIFITSAAITHTFLNFIPSIFLGAPDEDTALSVMPGHRFLLKGRGHEAVMLTLLGSIMSIVLLIFITPIFILIIPKVYFFIKRMMAWFLIWISIFLIANEKNSKLWAFIIFILAGFLGIASLNLPANQPLLPLLTGLFGCSTLIYSISKKASLPRQKIGKLIMRKKEIIKPAVATTIVSPICSFFPGLGSSQAAIIGSEILGKMDKKQFLILIGSINTFIMAISFLTLYLINKPRTGAANAIMQFSYISPKILFYIFIAIIVSAVISSLLTIQISKFFAKNIHKINYTKLSLIVLFFLIITIILISNFFGFLILIASTILGLTCIYVGIRRGFLMGSLLIPTILFYLSF